MKAKIFAMGLLVAGVVGAEPHQGVKVTQGAIYRATAGRSGVFNRTGVVQQPSVAWKTSLGGELKSSPVVMGGAVYIGAADGFHALDAETGAEKWVYPVAKGVDSSACVANDSVFFLTSDQRVVSLNTSDGKPRWEYKSKMARGENSISPAVVYGVVYAVADGKILALDFNTGRVLYEIKKNIPSAFCSPAFGPKEFYAMGVLNWGFLVAYDYATGKQNWQSVLPYDAGAGVYFFKSPAVDTDGSVYINETRGVRRFHPSNQGSAQAGQRDKLWFAFLLEKQVDDNELIPQTSPTPWNGRVYAGRKDGKFVCLDTKDGKQVWLRKMPDSVLSDPSIAAKSGLVYFGCHDGHLYALDAVTGAEKWKTPLGGHVFSSPWIEDNAIYAASGNGLVIKLK